MILRQGFLRDIVHQLVRLGYNPIITINPLALLCGYSHVKPKDKPLDDDMRDNNLSINELPLLCVMCLVSLGEVISVFEWGGGALNVRGTHLCFLSYLIFSNERNISFMRVLL